MTLFDQVLLGHNRMWVGDAASMHTSGSRSQQDSPVSSVEVDESDNESGGVHHPRAKQASADCV